MSSKSVCEAVDLGQADIEMQCKEFHYWNSLMDKPNITLQIEKWKREEFNRELDAIAYDRTIDWNKKNRRR